ncbi:MAG: hypothetical protein D8M58_20650 [Calditrichaeota bacterium]|nr:MAG: hypothetical protein DWQ03_00980 [Calditrichota bacterium]MBL1207821.1 hypothetical protein [Calditrichota bacterium]NOG47655.1 hypothetical protein [Calditrichota bacterium]
MKNQTRREFLINGSILSIAAISSTSTGSERLLSQPIEADKIQFPESDCSKNIDDNYKILIAYASEFESTAEVAIAISKVFCARGHFVETKWIKNIHSIQKYDAVILGSAIQYDKWMPEAEKFVQLNQKKLREIPVAYFFTCLTLSEKSKKTEKTASKYAEKLMAIDPLVNPLSIGQFAGVLDYDKMSLFKKLMFKTISLVTGVQEGDYRNWNIIDGWANNVHFRFSKKMKNKSDVNKV